MQPPISLLKILLDEDRLKILGVLALEACQMDDLAARTGLKPAALPRHLAQLVETGLIRLESSGGDTFCRLDVQTLHALKKDLFAPAPADSAPRSPQEQVLDNFLDGERLTQIPARHEKRLVVLAWLAGKFEVGARYPEHTVNEVLQRHHPDYASLRRYLVDYGFLAREGGVYWRTEAPPG